MVLGKDGTMALAPDARSRSSAHAKHMQRLRRAGAPSPLFRADCSRRYEGDAADLGLDFTVDEEAFGARRVAELLPGGADTPVVDANKLLYVHLAADWHLNGRLGAAAAAFANSFHQASRGQHGGV